MATITAGAAQSYAQPKATFGANAISVEYDLTASLSAGDVIQMAKLPEGARIVSGNIDFNLTSANTVTLSVGDGGSATRYLGNTSASANTTISNFTSGTGYSYSAVDTVDITVAAVTSATATGNIILNLVYVLQEDT